MLYFIQNFVTHLWKTLMLFMILSCFQHYCPFRWLVKQHIRHMLIRILVILAMLSFLHNLPAHLNKMLIFLTIWGYLLICHLLCPHTDHLNDKKGFMLAI